MLLSAFAACRGEGGRKADSESTAETGATAPSAARQRVAGPAREGHAPQETEAAPESEARGEGVATAARPERIEPSRPAVLAGSWYPASPEALRESIRAYLAAAEVEPLDPMALILPHAGHRWSGQTAAYGYRAIQGHEYRRVFILAPSHRVFLRGAAVPSVAAFDTPLGQVPVDTAVTEALAEQALVAIDDRPHAEEHAIEIQLPFLQVALPEGFSIVPIVVGQIDLDEARALAEALRPFVSNRDLVIASSDFTHYGASFDYRPFVDDVPARLRDLDMGALAAIQTGDPAELDRYYQDTGITVCGIRPIMVVMALLGEEAEVDLLHYDTSGRQTGDYSHCVSYLALAAVGGEWPASAELEPTGVEPDALARAAEAPRLLSAEDERRALRLARGVLETFVREGRVPSASELGLTLDGELAEAHGVFVTLKRDGDLRGCIGTIWPVMALGDAIIDRTVDAAAHDRRFRPVTPDELDEIEVEISVLTTPEPVSSYRDIVIGRHGVVLQRQGRRAVFLPQVAPEQGWDLAETLSHLSVKAGLPAEAWRSGCQFAVFEAQVFSESEHRL